MQNILIHKICSLWSLDYCSEVSNLSSEFVIFQWDMHESLNVLIEFYQVATIKRIKDDIVISMTNLYYIAGYREIRGQCWKYILPNLITLTIEYL